MDQDERDGIESQVRVLFSRNDIKIPLCHFILLG